MTKIVKLATIFCLTISSVYALSGRAAQVGFKAITEESSCDDIRASMTADLMALSADVESIRNDLNASVKNVDGLTPDVALSNTANHLKLISSLFEMCRLNYGAGESPRLDQKI